MTEHYKFHQNRACEYFPCHKIENDQEFNCLFCYCPLYTLQEHCGGNFKVTYGIKDCSDCLKPHRKDSYEFVMSKMDMVIEKGKIGGK